MHIDRLRNVKASLDMSKMAPKKPQHLKNNYKKEQMDQGKRRLSLIASR